MSDILCGYSGDREAALMAYLYDELTPEERAAFDAHLASCARCRVEMGGLRDVRQQLSTWSPPSFADGRDRAPLSPLYERADVHDAPATAQRSWWREMPAWAQAAAALLVLGASAGLANLDVHYDGPSGLSIRTGWTKSATQRLTAPNAAQPNGAQSAGAQPTDVARAIDPKPWRDDLAALEEQLRREFHDAAPSTSPIARNAALNDVDVLRRLKTLIDESEKRQQRELALRVAEVLRDVNAQRQADLRKIDQNLGLMQDRTGVEVLRTRQAVDYLLQRVSQR
jgi:anti-sigma factor RsiW